MFALIDPAGEETLYETVDEAVRAMQLEYEWECRENEPLTYGVDCSLSFMSCSVLDKYWEVVPVENELL